MEQKENGATEPQVRSVTSSFFHRFFSNPWIAFCASICSIISVPLAVLFGIQAIQNPILTYSVHPINSTIVKANETSKIAVYFDDKELTSDVTSMQVAFWNAGTRTIRSEHILEPLVLQVEPPSPILDVRITKQSRSVIELATDLTEIEKGRVKIFWKILEHQDGGVVQLVLAGSAESSIKATATIEGQPAINALNCSESFAPKKNSYEQMRRTLITTRASLWVYVLSLVPLLIRNFQKLKRRYTGAPMPAPKPISKLSMTIAFCIMVALSLTILGMAIYTTFFVMVPNPPFGF